MSVKNFFKNLGAQEDIEDRDEDYGDTYSDEDYDPRDRRKGDRRRADSRYADEDDGYYEPSRSGSRRRSSEIDDYDEPRHSSDDEDDYYGGSRRSDSRDRRDGGRTDRRCADDRYDDRYDDRSDDRYDDRYDDRDRAEYANAQYYDPNRDRRRSGVSGRRSGEIERTAARKAPSVLCFLPDTYMQCREELVAGLKEGNVVVVDMRKLEPSAMTRLLDFMSGVGQALDADMYRLDESTMIVLTQVEIELDINELQERMNDNEEIDEEMDVEIDEEFFDDESDDAEDDDL